MEMATHLGDTSRQEQALPSESNLITISQESHSTMPWQPHKPQQHWATARLQMLTDANDKLVTAEGEIAAFKAGFRGLEPEESDEAIDALLTVCFHIERADSSSIAGVMYAVGVCGRAANRLGQNELSKPMSDTCAGSATWVTEKQWAQVQEYGRNLKECVETIRAKIGQPPESEQEDQNFKPLQGEHDRLKKLLEDNAFRPRGEEVFNSNPFTLHSGTSNDGILLYALFRRLVAVENFVEAMRQYLNKMARHVINKYFS